jgi:RecA-family ATPase
MALVDFVKRLCPPAAYTAQEIMDMDPSQTTTIVPGIISQGVTLLASKPKIGKSYLCLHIGLGVASGGKVLGIEVAAQDVLYMALEDKKEDMQQRLQKMLGSAPAPDRLKIVFKWDPIGKGGLQDLEEWLVKHPETRLVIIDTLGKICDLNQGNYHADYEIISKFKDIAARHKIAIVLVHHLRKTGARDEFDGVSGSTGLTGAVDTIVILKRKRLQTEATLLISGRNQKEAELALRFDQTTGIWEPREQTEENHLTPERHEIVELLKKAPAPLRLQEIAQALGKKRANVGNLMNKLIKQGITERISYGHYQLKGGPATGSGVKSKLIEEKTPGMTVEELDALLAKKVAEIQKQIEYLCETVPSVVES